MNQVQSIMSLMKYDLNTSHKESFSPAFHELTELFRTI